MRPDQNPSIADLPTGLDAIGCCELIIRTVCAIVVAMKFVGLVVLGCVLVLSAEAIEPPRHARGFVYRDVAEGILVQVGDAGQWRYLLVNDAQSAARTTDWIGATAQRHRATVIRTPVTRIATLSTTHLPSLVALNLLDRLIAHNGIRWVFSEEIHRRAEQGSVIDVGSGGTIDVERLLLRRPDVVIAYPDLGHSSLVPLERLNVPLVMNLEYLEQTPLGRSEWIVYVGDLMGAGTRARALFAEIERRYERLRRLVHDVDRVDRPTVLIGAPWGSQWPAGAGSSYEATLIEDAGGRYVWRDTAGSGTLMLDFESVYAMGRDADIWINTGTSFDDLIASEPRLADFRALRRKRVYNNDARRTAAGGIDYFESGALYADRILADLIHIFHPSLLPDHELFYYRSVTPSGHIRQPQSGQSRSAGSRSAGSRSAEAHE